MKNLCILLMLSFAVLLSGCDDDKDGLKLSPASLKQTSWEGTKTYKYREDGRDVDAVERVSIQFLSDGSGDYEDWRDDGEGGRIDGQKHDFSYAVACKILTITELRYGGVPFVWNWTLTEKSNDKMVFVEDVDSATPVTYTLTRVY